MTRIPIGLADYHATGKPLICELDVNPYWCEFWALDELDVYNQEYQMPEYAPGFFGFATSGGGEMFAIAPDGAVVCLPLIGMQPAAASPIAPTWSDFEGLLRNPVP